MVGVTVGNFDGMHLGHQTLIETLLQEVQSCAGRRRKVLFSFYPHPATVLRPEASSSSPLMPVREKYEFARAQGCDLMFSPHFTRAFSMLTPEEFVSQYFVKALQAKVIVVGYDWKFGKSRSGDTDLLQEMGKKWGFKVVVVSPVMVHGVRVSTSAVKAALESGDLGQVRALLGREFSISGKVCHGDQRGRTLGFPTANIDENRVLPKNGVYVTRVEVDSKWYPSVTNVGVRPTFGGSGRRLVEVHLLEGLHWNLYRKRITVQFVERLRDELTFSSVSELKDAITEDVKRSREVLEV